MKPETQYLLQQSRAFRNLQRQRVTLLECHRNRDALVQTVYSVVQNMVNGLISYLIGKGIINKEDASDVLSHIKNYAQFATEVAQLLYKEPVTSDNMNDILNNVEQIAEKHGVNYYEDVKYLIEQMVKANAASDTQTESTA